MFLITLLETTSFSKIVLSFFLYSLRKLLQQCCALFVRANPKLLQEFDRHHGIKGTGFQLQGKCHANTCKVEKREEGEEERRI